MRRSPRLVATALVLAVAAATALAGCGSDGGAATADSAQKPRRGGEVTVLRSADIDAWDPDKALMIETFETLPQVMEGLVRPNPEGTDVLPGLADRWEIDAAAKTITFHLREGAAFSDGSPVTASDVAFSVGLWRKNVAYGTLYSAITGTRTPDDRTVVITMSRPSTFTLSWLANGTAVVVPKDFDGKTRADFFKNPIGAGAFEIKRYVPGQSLTLARNPHYYDPKRPYLDRLTYKVVTDPNQQLLQFQSKQAQMIESVPLDLARQFSATERHVVEPTATVHAAFVNTASGPGRDLHFREAVSHAIDRDTYVKSVFGDIASPAKGGLPTGVQGSATCGCSYDFDLAKAKQELAESSYDGSPVVVLVDSSSQITTRGGEVLVEMLKAAGIKADLQPEEGQVMFDRYSKGDYDLELAEVSSVSPSVGDIFGLVSYMVQASDKDKVITTAFDKLDVAATDTARTEATTTAEDWIGSNLPYVPIANPGRVYAVAATVRGLAVTPYLSYPADRLWTR
ncbi:MAG: ABC transporter substrate-binding protein [Nocardioidaceae bacterium]|nr:ABC transporter substrate-binding protein [Nocardioidaceae bacterium]